MSNIRRNNQKALSLTVLSIVICLFMVGHVSASSIDSIQLFKISPQDERAIIKTSDGKMQIIKPGDVVGTDSKVVEITAGRVVFEEKTDNETETVIIRLEDGKQRVERIKKAAEKQPQLYGVKAPRDEKVAGNEPVKGKKKDKKNKPVNEFKKSSVVN